MRAIQVGEVGGPFPLADAAAAHRALDGRRTTGKLLLTMSPTSDGMRSGASNAGGTR